MRKACSALSTFGSQSEQVANPAGKEFTAHSPEPVSELNFA